MNTQYAKKISVVMAIHNGQEYLVEQIESIKSQLLLPDEVIFVDDASNEDPSQLIQDTLKGSLIKFTILKNKKNMGVNFTFRRGVKAAKGDIIFFSDQDDIWLNSKIKTVVSFFKSNPMASVLINDCTFLRDGEVSSGKTKAKAILDYSGTNDYFVAGCCTAFDKIILSAIEKGLYDNLNYDDQVHMIARSLERRFFINEPLQLYRRHMNNHSLIPQNDGVKPTLRGKYNNKLMHEFVKFFFIDLLIMDPKELADHNNKIKLLKNNFNQVWVKHSQLVELVVTIVETSNKKSLIYTNIFNGVIYRVIFGYYFIKVIKFFKSIK